MLEKINFYLALLVVSSMLAGKVEHPLCQKRQGNVAA